MWNNPRLLVTTVLKYARQFSGKSSFIMRHGFEIVWKTIVKEENLDIRYMSDIVEISRYSDKVILTMKNHQLNRAFFPMTMILVISYH